MQKFCKSSPLSASGFQLGKSLNVCYDGDAATSSSSSFSSTPVARVPLEDTSSVYVPSIAIESTLEKRPITPSENIEGDDSQYQNRKWRFSNSGVKYEVTVPLPPFQSLQALNILHDAFRLLYKNSGTSVSIKSILSNKRKASDGLSRESNV